MKNKPTLIFSFLLLSAILFTPYCAYALDWKILHEQADELTLSQALVSLQSNPDSLDAMYILGLVYLNYYQDEFAEEFFKKMIRKSPGMIEAEWGIAEVLRRKKQVELSQRMLNQIIKTNPGFSPAYISLAYIKYTQGDFNKAVRLAVIVRRQGRDKVDLSNYTRSYLIYAGSKGMIASRGGPLSKLINGTEVLPNLKKAEELQPDSPAVLFGLGSFYFLAPGIAGGNLNKALRCLERATEADPLFVDAYVRLAQVYKAKGDEEKYRFYLDKARTIGPDNELLRDETSGVCKFNCVTVEE